MPFTQSCLKSSKPGLPADVVKVIQNTGHNRIELIKALSVLIESDDIAKREALYFLIGNMGRQYAVEYQITDSANNVLSFDPMQYPDYQSMLSAWDSLSTCPGGMMFSAKRYTLDRDTIKSELLLNTIELAFASKNYPWAKRLPDSIFLRYVLPYRVANEDLEDWRPLMHQYITNLVPKINLSSINHAAKAINRKIDSTLSTEIRLIKKPNIALPSQIIKNGMANPRDIAIFKVMALRSVGIPATLDYVPWMSDSLNSLWIVAYYDENNKWQSILPKASDSNLFKVAGCIPKIYRRVFHSLDSSLFALKDINKTTPPFLGHYDYLDVTSHYLPVNDIRYRGKCPDYLIYLAVFNGKNWKPVDWAFCSGDSALFKHVGEGVNHRFVWFEKVGDYEKIHLLSPENQFD